MDFDRQIAAIRDAYASILDAESAVAYKHRSDPYWSSGGHNVGRDEQLAVVYAQRLNLRPNPDEQDDLLRYANRLLDDLEGMKVEFRAEEEDPDGFGIGTLHGVSRKLVAALREMGVKVSER